ncbi:unnamed protein product (plasmid) [Mycetohabitans rhizoxinica HKI 454]|uniref:Uncharacterized protein n=1 Tax=Mycetohabitans rhizoxinica (strain DSM 19002 / CIP 109453 / HKI 454) TaxID=882378 RepID=E5AUQ7_MYCRK|nr:hypothetical protein [Mycetohabitans rhizoxinica]CBW76831.1 unnamed protein product [Mycetohabitans rhizoxinica HKI 454]
MDNQAPLERAAKCLPIASTRWPRFVSGKLTVETNTPPRLSTNHEAASAGGLAPPMLPAKRTPPASISSVRKPGKNGGVASGSALSAAERLAGLCY